MLSRGVAGFLYRATAHSETERSGIELSRRGAQSWLQKNATAHRRSEAESNCHGEELYAATAGRKWSNYGEKEERYHRASVL